MNNLTRLSNPIFLYLSHGECILEKIHSVALTTVKFRKHHQFQAFHRKY